MQKVSVSLTANTPERVPVNIIPSGMRLVSGPGSVTFKTHDSNTYGPYLQRTKIFFAFEGKEYNFTPVWSFTASVTGNYVFEFFSGEDIQTEPTIQVSVGETYNTTIVNAVSDSDYSIVILGASWCRLVYEGSNDAINMQMKCGDPATGTYKSYAPDVYDLSGAKCAYSGLTASNLPEYSILNGQGIYWVLLPGALTIRVNHATSNVNLVFSTIAFGAGPWGFVTK
jgi:hypothetical protein